MFLLRYLVQALKCGSVAKVHLKNILEYVLLFFLVQLMLQSDLFG